MHTFSLRIFARVGASVARSAFPSLRLSIAVLVTSIAAIATHAQQLSYSTAGSTLTQDFNAGANQNANNSLTWTDGTTTNFNGWYIYRETGGTPTNYRRNSTSSSGNVQHFRMTNTTTDGALGGRPNDNTEDLHYAIRIRNNTGSTLRTFTLSYALEQWYRSGVTEPSEMLVSWRLSTPTNLADDGNWVSIHRLTLQAPQLGGTAGDIDGSLSANRATSDTFTVGGAGFSWAPNTDLWIRFSDANDTGVDQGLAIDDVVFKAFTSTTVPLGHSQFGRYGYTEYQAGDCPIIIVTGHGGIEQPAEVADRTDAPPYTDAVLVPDQNTEDLARRIVNEIYARSGKRPHLIANRLHRGKLDPNREIGEAAQGDARAIEAYNDFHAFIEQARLAIEPQFGFGFLVDIHGHSHDLQNPAWARLEFGYNLNATDLNKTDAELERPTYGENFSMRTHNHRPGVSLPTLIRGARSFGDLLKRRGNYDGVPSPNIPGPGSDPYFAGGYNIEEHGSLKNVGNVQSMQIESQKSGVRDTWSNRQTFAEALASTIHDFVFDQFGYELGSGSVFKLTASATRLYENSGTVTLTVTRSGYRPNAESIALSYAGTATRGTDYNNASTSVSFAANETTKTITITPTQDTAQEGTETIIVALNPTPLQTADVLPITIALSDDDRVSVHAAALQTSATEGGSTANVQITRDVVTGSSLTATLAFGGTAVRGLDYTVTGVDGMNRVVIPANTASVNIGIVPLNDSLQEPTKTVDVSVVSSANYHVGFPNSASVAILDNDHDSALQLWLHHRIADGIWRDETSFARNGALRPVDSQAPVTSAGVVGTALEFDGQDDAVVIPYFAMPTSFTLAFRFRLDATSTSTAFRHLFNIGGYEQPNSLTIHRVESNDKIRTAIKNSSGSPTSTALDVSNMTATGTWRHYALVASTAGAGSLKVYINGVESASVTNWNGAFTPSAALWLGWRGDYSTIASRHLDGAMEDFRLYSRALSGTEVAALATVPNTTTLTSVATHDGWVLESSETSNVGGSSDATGSTLRTGDDVDKKQYKAILSFDTSGIPSGATILSATLKLRRNAVIGTNPFGTHGECLVDIKGGTGFGGSTTLANGDFEASADATAVAVMSNAAVSGDWSSGTLSPTGIGHINRSGHTQFRVYFTTDDNNNTTADYVAWSSANDSTPTYRPVLEIIYR